MLQRILHDKSVECLAGDITAQPDIDAVVNAANAELRPGGGVAGAIHRAAGPKLDAACRPLAPIRPGEAVITPAYDLPNSFVIHCLGPVYGRDEPADALLAACYRAALQRAEENGVASLAFPAISTGAFGFPPDRAAQIALSTVCERLPALRVVRQVRHVLFSEAELLRYEAILTRLTEEGPGEISRQ